MKLLIALTSLLFISSCQTAMEVQKASQNGVASSYSCAQITSTFSAYERDKTALAPLLDIAKMTGLNVEQNTEGFDPSQYYNTAKTSANVALLVQGCPAL